MRRQLELLSILYITWTCFFGSPVTAVSGEVCSIGDRSVPLDRLAGGFLVTEGDHRTFQEVNAEEVNKQTLSALFLTVASCAFRFAFSLFCFFASFCGSVWVLEWLYETKLSLDPTSRSRARKTRPYSSTLVRLQSELEKSCAKSETKVVCLADQYLNAAEVAEVVLPVITQHKARQWKSLDLSCNEITDAGLERLMDALLDEECDCGLEEISLKRCGLRTVVPGLLRYMDESRSSLKELHLGNNNLDDRSIAALAKALPYSNLKVLNLSYNDLTDESLRQFCIHSNGHSSYALRQLHLRGNRIMDRGVSILAESDVFVDLQLLDLTSNPITDDGLKALVKTFRSRRQLGLNELSLAENAFITDRGVRDLVMAAMGAQLRLTSLLLYNMRLLTDQVFECLDRSFIRPNPYAKRVCLSSNPQLDAEKTYKLENLLRMTRSNWFRTSIVLLATKDVRRIAERRHKGWFDLLNKDLVRMIVELVAEKA